MINSLQQLIDLYTSVFYLEDTSVIPLVVAAVVANRFPGDPVWLMLTGASSSGKSEIINAITDMEINGVQKIWQISSLTENTFLSGATRNGKDSSLLKRLGSNGIIVMKDFTTQLSQNSDKAQAIFSQFREIYDGYYTKETGLGQSLSWRGKINFIGGVTEKIYVMEKKYGGMGTRALNFLIPSCDRKNMTRRAIENSTVIEAKRLEIKKGFSEYVNHLIEGLRTYSTIPPIPSDHSEDIINVADFSCMCRSATERNYMGQLELTHEPEMPSRMAKQMMGLTNVFIFMNNGELPEYFREIIYRIALDSIPKGRRMALRELARYAKVATSGVATKLNYPSDTVKEWLEDLNVLGVITRVKGTAAYQGDRWEIKPEYRKIMIDFDNVKVEAGELIEDSIDDMDTVELEEADQRAEALFDSI